LPFITVDFWVEAAANTTGVAELLLCTPSEVLTPTMESLGAAATAEPHVQLPVMCKLFCSSVPSISAEQSGSPAAPTWLQTAEKRHRTQYI